MFGMRSTSASYGRAFALENVPNLVPHPSGGLGAASVHNTSNDLVANDTPSTFLVPSLHPGLISTQNEFNDGDFVFALNPRDPFPRYSLDYRSSRNIGETLVTLPMLNELICGLAREDKEPNNTNQFWKDPVQVKQWARPLGVVINKMKVNVGATRAGQDTHYGLNICVSRKANIKHNFMSIKHGGKADWFAQSTMPLAVQYSVESCNLTDGAQPVNLVVVSMLLIDGKIDEGRTDPIVLENSCCTSADSVNRFMQNPCKQKAVLVQIGRVLNSSARSPTAYMALHSNLSKSMYDSLPPIEVELGCN